MTAPKESIVIPNAVRNQVGRDVAELEHLSGLATLITAIETINDSHLIPHCVRNDKGGLGAVG
jgi:hypothetical protein